MSEIYKDHFELQIEKHNLPRAFEVIEEARGRAAADRLADKIRARVPHTLEEVAIKDSYENCRLTYSMKKISYAGRRLKTKFRGSKRISSSQLHRRR